MFKSRADLTQAAARFSGAPSNLDSLPRSENSWKAAETGASYVYIDVYSCVATPPHILP